MSQEVFISYKAEEFSQAVWVKNRIEAAGFSCWMAPASIPGGSSYAIQIPQAIRNCKVFVLILSSRAQNSIWIPRELDQAINAGKTIMPFFIENCPLRDDFSFYLSNVQHYDAWKNRERAIEEMIGDIQLDSSEGKQVPPPPGPPRFPFKIPIAITALVVIILAVRVFSDALCSDDQSASTGTTEINNANQTTTQIETTDENNVENEPDDTPDSDQDSSSVEYNTKGEVRVLNKKYAQDLEFQHLAKRFEEDSGIRVTVESPAVGSYSKALEENITGSKNDPTLFMLSGLNDFEEYGGECLDLTHCPAAAEVLPTDNSYILQGQNGKTYGLACIVESYGLCVNTRLLEKAGYKVTDIQSFTDLKRITRDITRRKDDLGFSAFTAPSIDIGISGDYRFAEHAPAVPLYYELNDNDFNIRLKLQGTYMDNFRDYIDLYLDNSTVPRGASGYSIEDAQEEFLMEKAVFHQDGSWNLEKIEAIMTKNGAVIPLYMGMPGEEKQGLNKTCSYYWCVNKYASEDDIEATLQFLYWLVTSETGIDIMTREMGFQIPYRKSEVPDNIFMKSLSNEEKEGCEPISQYYKYGNYNTWTNSIRRTLKAYAEGSGNWSSVVEAFGTLW